MKVTVYIPTSLRRLTGNQARVAIEGANVGEVLARLEEQFPALRGQIRDEKGCVLRHVNVYLNNQEIHELQGTDTPVRDGDEVAVVPALAGGAGVVQVFTPEQMKRYHRHIIMPEVGGKGQRRLLNAKVLLIGAGGLGSPAALYLAAAGVGTLGIVDFDVVDISNLQRQIIHHLHDVGRPKVLSAAESIRDINPDVKVVPHEVALSSENALEIFSQYDIIVNGCDNFPTRYLANDACVLLGKPLVDAAIFRFEGQATVFMPGQGCYRCLYPEPPPPGAVASCAEAGVLGVLPGLLGCIQATETIKLILGIGEPLVGRMLLVDALNMEFREVKTRRDPNCPVCGDNPTIKELIDYHEFCGVPRPHSDKEDLELAASRAGVAARA
jgi:molybdopterin/thiamine biosynthesis adenylyltransferase/molybdopterin converting factor small subunit